MTGIEGTKTGARGKEQVMGLWVMGDGKGLNAVPMTYDLFHHSLPHHDPLYVLSDPPGSIYTEKNKTGYGSSVMDHRCGLHAFPITHDL